MKNYYITLQLKDGYTWSEWYEANTMAEAILYAMDGRDGKGVTVVNVQH